LDEDAAAMLDEQTGRTSTTGRRSEQSRQAQVSGTAFGTDNHKSIEYPGEDGFASRFFYCAKASRKERDAGLEDWEKKPLLWSAGTQTPGSFQSPNTERAARNNHPTVKPLKLMRWLCRLVTPPHGVILDHMMGSGSTGCAAVLEGFDFIGIEQEAYFVDIAQARIEYWQQQVT
jgi:DNA modification methylase